VTFNREAPLVKREGFLDARLPPTARRWDWEMTNGKCGWQYIVNLGQSGWEGIYGGIFCIAHSPDSHLYYQHVTTTSRTHVRGGAIRLGTEVL